MPDKPPKGRASGNLAGMRDYIDYWIKHGYATEKAVLVLPRINIKEQMEDKTEKAPSRLVIELDDHETWKAAMGQWQRIIAQCRNNMSIAKSLLIEALTEMTNAKINKRLAEDDLDVYEDDWGLHKKP